MLTELLLPPLGDLHLGAGFQLANCHSKYVFIIVFKTKSEAGGSTHALHSSLLVQIRKGSLSCVGAPAVDARADNWADILLNPQRDRGFLIFN